jgi:hypothetical protein
MTSRPVRAGGSHRPITTTIARARTPLSAAALAALALAAHAATDPYTLAVQETVSHDSNVYRVSNTAAEQPTDWISTTSVIGSLDQPIGRERLKLSGEFDVNRFKSQHQLNSTAHSLSGELDWSTIDRVSGEVGFSNLRQLYRFALDNGDLPTTLANIQTVNQGFARARVGVVTDWTLSASATLYDRTFSASQYQFNDLRHHDASLGIIWRDTPDLALNLTLRRTVGEYPNVTDANNADGDKYDRNDATLGAVWTPSGASTLRAAFGTARESHSVAVQRDSRHWTANAAWQWQATGRTQLSLSFVRDNDTGSSEESFFGLPLVNTDARIRTAWNGTAAYALTGKINLTASGGYAVRQLDSALAFGGSSQGSTKVSDRLYSASLGVEWRPTRAIDLSCSGSRERRVLLGAVSSQLSYSYGAVVLSCMGQFAFN